MLSISTKLARPLYAVAGVSASTCSAPNPVTNIALRLFASTATSSDRLEGFDAPSVFTEFTSLAMEAKAVNLGQGFPGWPAERFVKDAAINAINSDDNQYCRSAGHPRLVATLAEHYSSALGREVNSLTEVVVTAGATEGLFAAAQAFIEPGDEAILLEPAYDSYPAVVKMAGGLTKSVPLRSSDDALQNTSNDVFFLDLEELEAAITPKTRALFLNTPHNPTGKVFSMEELVGIAGVLERHPHVTVFADEVYDRLVYSDVAGQRSQHISIASVPGMWERTVTISSIGKTFSCTGWKVGWAVGPAHLISRLMSVVQWTKYCTSTPLQVAGATMMETASEAYEGESSFYDWVVKGYTQKMDLLHSALDSTGLKPILPNGGFFMTARTDHLNVPETYFQTTPSGPRLPRDWALCRWLCLEAGVVAIPPSAFYSSQNKHLAQGMARFAFCKSPEEIKEAHKRLEVFLG